MWPPCLKHHGFLDSWMMHFIFMGIRDPRHLHTLPSPNLYSFGGPEIALFRREMSVSPNV